jgi:hypothetical protein
MYGNTHLSYYRPYKPDEESDIESGSTDYDSDYSTTSSEGPKGLVKAAGISLIDVKQQLDYGVRRINKNVDFAYYDPPPPTSNINYGGTQFDSRTNTLQSIVVLNSRDRDRLVFPQPTNLVLRLPRVYRNVTNIQFTQLSLLSAFYYFRTDKQNVKFFIAEQDRNNNNRQLGEPNGFPVTIDNGSYDINALMAELNQKMNLYPLFYDFPNGFIEFAQKFNSTGDLATGFNEVGDYFYDIINNTYVSGPNLTKTYVTQTFFQARLTNQTSFTLTEIKCAYYYPPLKQHLLENPTNYVVSLSGIDPALLLPSETVLTRILYTFQGLADPVVAQVINNNIPFLDRYRDLNTFKYHLVNKYVASVDDTINLVTFTSPNLNTSLVNLLNLQYTNFFNTELANRGMTASNYALSNSFLYQYNSILLGMYDFLQTNLANIYGIDYNTYSMSYLANPSYQIFIRDGNNLTGVAKTLTSNVLYAGIDPISYFSFQIDPPVGGWPALRDSIVDTTDMVNTNTFLNKSYSIIKNDVLQNRLFINSNNNYVNIDRRTNSADIIVPVTAQKYTLIMFTSPMNQTLQVETLSRPVKYRYPAYNSAFNKDSNLVALFNYSYEFVNNSNSDAILPDDLTAVGGTWDSLINVASPIVFGESNVEIIPPVSCDPFTYFNSIFMKFTTPGVPNGPRNSVNKYAITFSMNVNTPNPVIAYMYHDRALMMADVTSGSNSPLHYKISYNIDPTQTVADLTWNAYESNTYYVVVKPSQIPFSKFTITPSVYFPNTANYTSFTTDLFGFDPTIDPTTDPNFFGNFNYAKVYDPDYIRIPISQSLWGIEPTNYSNNIILPVSSTQLGYDTTGYSFDLTDYRPSSRLNGQTILTTTNNYDPIAPEQAFFVFLSPYRASNETYFYPGSINSILTTSNEIYNSVPTYAPDARREHKMVNWFDSTYIGSEIQSGLSNLNLPANIPYAKTPYTLQSTCNIPIGGYRYDSASNLTVYDGICGFTFLPDGGIWSLKSLMFNTGVMNRSNNNNHHIQYIGVYNTVDIYNTSYQAIALSNALVKLQLVRRRYYLPSQCNNPTFLNGEYAANPSEYAFDIKVVKYGSYFQFETVEENDNLNGYSENARIFLNDAENFYSAITFDANSNVIAITQLAGSIVPFPLPGYSYPQVSNVYFDGSAPDNGRQLIRPSPITCNLPGGLDFSQVGYQQSMRYTTTSVHMINSTQQIYDPYAIKPFDYNALNKPAGLSANMVDNNKGYLVVNDGVFRILSYEADGSRILTPAGTLTVDDIYPSASGINLVAYTTNSTGIYFMGLNSNGVVNIRTFNIANGSLSNITIAGNPVSVTVPLDQRVLQFAYNDEDSFFFTTYSSSRNLYYYFSRHSPNIGIASNLPSVLNASLPNNQPIYFDLSVNSRSNIVMASNLIYSYNIYEPNAGTLITLPGGATSNYRNAIQVNENGSNAFYCLAGQRFVKFDRTSTGNPIQSEQILTGGSEQDTFISGAFGSKWLVNSVYPYIYGNRFVLDGTLDTAWQIFYPSFKFTFNKIANQTMPIVDLKNIEPPEYFHTNMFVYNDMVKMSNDIAHSWGMESSNNYLCSDTQFRGFQFNSYINNVPLQSNVTYYLAIRGYAPSEQFETMVRFYLPNRYDFRWLTLVDISNEIAIVEPFMASNNGVSPYNFNPVYALSLSNFDTLFQGARTFGANIIPGFNGVSYNTHTTRNTLIWLGFADFYDAYSFYYTEYLGILNILNGITRAALSNLNNFIATQLVNILPANALSRSRFTDPLLYSILFGSGNSYQFGGLEEEWGLGWNLGFPKVDTAYSTRHTGNSFYKILDSYVYVKLNDEFNINRLDTTGKENLQATREPTGLVGKYNIKLLLANFNGYTNTAIMNPVEMNPPLAKLDKITFQLMDLGGNVINNTDCEWNACVNISEMLDQPTAQASIIKYNSTSK